MWSHTHTHTHEHYSTLKKEGNPALCDNIDGPWGHNARWNKPEKDNYAWYHLQVESFFKKSQT